MSTETNQQQEEQILANPFIRALAFMIDIIVMISVGLIVGFFAFDYLAELGIYGKLAGLGICLIYFVVLNSSIGNGQTIGKKIFGIRVVGGNGKGVPVILSVISYTVLLAPFFLGNIAFYLFKQKDTVLFGAIIYIIIFFMTGAIAYLFMFNWSNRQFLHNFIIRSFVIKNKAENYSFRKLWKYHFIPMIFWLLLGAYLFLPLPYMFNLIGRIAPYPTANDSAIGSKEQAAYDIVYKWENYTTDSGKKLELVMIISSNKPIKNQSAVCTEFADSMINDYFEKSNQADLITIKLKWGYDIGIAHRYKTYTETSSLLGWINRANSLYATDNSQTISIFNNAEPVPVRDIGIRDLEKSWFETKVTKKVGGMFSPVYLPFDYKSNIGEDDARQTLTFPCLLSFKFDFVPDNYSARHPAFIYRKKPIWNVKPYQKQKMSDYAEYWEATHIIGGSVTQEADGYTGEIIVFNKSGDEVLKKSFEKPMPYFTLMGEMVKCWMDYRGQNVSDGLYSELIRPMTTDMECVRLYGTTFDVEWRTQAEWDIYEQILHRDKDFAEVRQWYANQKNWTIDDDTGSLNLEKGKVLQSHLVMGALSEFDIKRCSDTNVVDNWFKVLDYAEKICGNHTVVLTAKIYSYNDKVPLEVLAKYLGIAKEYPCSANFINQVAGQYRARGIYSKSIPLYLSSIQSGYLKGIGRYDWEWCLLQRDFYDLGYMDESINCGLAALKDCDKDNKKSIYWYLASAFREQNNYGLAATLFKERELVEADGWGYFSGYISLYEAGDKDAMKNWLEFFNDNESKMKFDPFVKAIGFMAEKDKKALPALLSCKEFTKSSTLQFEMELLMADAYLLSGDTEKAKESAVNAWQICPRSKRATYFLAKTTQEDSAAFKHYAKVCAFIFDDDPYWQKFTPYIISTDEREQVLRRYDEIMAELTGLSPEDEKKYWAKFEPFELEYISLCLAKSFPGNTDFKGLKLYERYAKFPPYDSGYHKIHIETFCPQLIDYNINLK